MIWTILPVATSFLLASTSPTTRRNKQQQMNNHHQPSQAVVEEESKNVPPRPISGKDNDKDNFEGGRGHPRYCDVAVIGSGFAGLAAAVEAATILSSSSGNDSDGKVLVIEKMHKPGGNSVMNAGQLAVVGSAAQKLAGIDDSAELMMEDMLKAGVELNHPDLLRTMIENSNSVFEWTQSELGVEYRDRVTQMGGHSVPRTVSTVHASGNDIIRPMLHKLQAEHGGDLSKNAQILLDTSFETFLTEQQPSEDGERLVTAVTGVQLKDKDGNRFTVYCRKGVVLAAGGFGADVAFRSIQNPSFGAKVDSTNQPGATAEVIKEALKLGAMSVQLSRIQLGPWTSPDEHGFGKAPFFCLGAGFPYGIIVDPQTSKRFVNEMGNRFERSMAILNKVGHPVVCFTDWSGAQHSLNPDLDHLHPGVKRFDSLQELAEHFDMDATVLQETVDSYNQGVKNGKDEEYNKPLRDDLEPIVKPPFYACRLWPKVHHCMGGLHISSQAEVMHIDGYHIPGLYAAGEVTGGIHGADRLGSCATLDCLSFGRIAGRQAASRITPFAVSSSFKEEVTTTTNNNPQKEGVANAQSS